MSTRLLQSQRCGTGKEPEPALLQGHRAHTVAAVAASVQLGPPHRAEPWIPLPLPALQEQHLPSHSGRRQGSTGPSISLINFLLQLGELRLEPRGLQGPQVNGI